MSGKLPHHSRRARTVEKEETQKHAQWSQAMRRSNVKLVKKALQSLLLGDEGNNRTKWDSRQELKINFIVACIQFCS